MKRLKPGKQKVKRLLISVAIRIIGLLLAAGTLIGFLRRRRVAPVYPTATSLLTEPTVDAHVNRDAEGEWTIRWEIPTHTVSIYSGPTPATINYNDVRAVVADVQTITLAADAVPPLHPYFALVFSGGPYDGHTLITTEREITFEGAVNFRDIGGYRTEDGRYTRWGLVFRAGQLSRLTKDDLQAAALAGMRVVCDLRSDEEIVEEPDKLPITIDYVRLPVHTDATPFQRLQALFTNRRQMDQFMVRLYTEIMIDQNPHIFGAVLKRIAHADNLPLVFHCTAGKDRTGVTAALLLALLGVPDETIMADYSLSNRYFDVYEAIGEAAIAPFKRFGITKERLQPLFTANPAVIQATLVYIREKYGSVAHYLREQADVDEDELAAISQNLLMDPAKERED